MASVSVNGFILVMEEFIGKLKLAFPEKVAGLKQFETSFELLRDTNPRKLVELYFAGLSPYVDKIKNKDESFILEDLSNIEVLKHIKIDSLWGSAKPGTQKAVWEYLLCLHQMAFEICTKAGNQAGDMMDAVKNLQAGDISKMMSSPDVTNMLGGLDTGDISQMMTQVNGNDIKKMMNDIDPETLEQMVKSMGSLFGGMMKK